VGIWFAELENDVLVDQFPRILVSTDKPIYQPGQKLHMRAVALSPTKVALANQDVIFRVDDPEDTNVFSRVGKELALWRGQRRLGHSGECAPG
jgi:hypothetical protein